MKNSHAPRDESLESVKQKSHALCRELSWAYYRLLMRVENELARNYYLKEAIVQNSEKNETVVKYSLSKEIKQLFTSKYKLYLPTEEEFKKELETELLQLKLQKES